MKTLDEAMRRAGDVFTDTFWSDPRNNPLPTIPIIRDMGRDAMAAALASLAADGWPVVPREATNEMQIAGTNAYQSPAAIWFAMLAAAPKLGDGA